MADFLHDDVFDSGLSVLDTLTAFHGLYPYVVDILQVLNPKAK